MKRLITLCLFILSLSNIKSQWRQVVNNGFGDANNTAATWLEVFNNQIYAATSRSAGNGPIQIWRSSNGYAGTWAQISNSNFSPPIPVSTTAVYTMFQSGGHFWFGTQNTGPAGPALYRTIDGTNWTQINGAGSGFVNGNNTLIIGFAIKDGLLYIGTTTSVMGPKPGAQVWRRPIDESAQWTKVLDFQDGTGLPSGIPIANTGGITYLWFWSKTGRLYASNVFKNLSGGGQLWESYDGINWTKNAGVNDGFGIPQNSNIASIVDFTSADGNYLYATTHNVQNGGQCWRTSDGVTWEKIANNGFGDRNNQELHNIRVALGKLWITTLTVSPSSAQVWTSTTGGSGTFVQSNTNGFGVTENREGFPTTIGLGNFVFRGGGNATYGAQIYSIGLPFSPIAVAATGITQTSFIANWDASAEATGYDLDVSTDNGFASLVSGYNNKDVNNVKLHSQ